MKLSFLLAATLCSVLTSYSSEDINDTSVSQELRKEALPLKKMKNTSWLDSGDKLVVQMSEKHFKTKRAKTNVARKEIILEQRSVAQPKLAKYHLKDKIDETEDLYDIEDCSGDNCSYESVSSITDSDDDVPEVPQDETEIMQAWTDCAARDKVKVVHYKGLTTVISKCDTVIYGDVPTAKAQDLAYFIQPVSIYFTSSVFLASSVTATSVKTSSVTISTGHLAAVTTANTPYTSLFTITATVTGNYSTIVYSSVTSDIALTTNIQYSTSTVTVITTDYSTSAVQQTSTVPMTVRLAVTTTNFLYYSPVVTIVPTTTLILKSSVKFNLTISNTPSVSSVSVTTSMDDITVFGTSQYMMFFTSNSQDSSSTTLCPMSSLSAILRTDAPQLPKVVRI